MMVAVTWRGKQIARARARATVDHRPHCPQAIDQSAMRITAISVAQ
jgi:hypothetical protein